MDWSLRQIEVFCVVARVLHFGRAAEELYVSQAMVSQEIRRLEAHLHARLFDRTTRRVALTEFGEQLLPYAQEVSDAARTLTVMARRLDPQGRRTIRLAATPSAMDGFVPAVLRAAEAEGAIGIDEVAVETGSLLVALESGEADLGLGRYLASTPGFQIEQLYEEPLAVLISAGHPLSAEPTIDLSCLADLPLLLWPREVHPVYHDAILAICRDRGLDPLVMTARASITGPRSYLLSEGRVFALVPQSSARTAPAGVVARPPTRPAAVPMSLIWRRNDPRPSLRQLVDLVRRVAAARVAGSPADV